MANWYYRIRNQEFGPVADLGLAALLADGSLRPTDEVRMDGEYEWRPASASLSLHASQAVTQEWSEGELDHMLVAEAPVARSRASHHITDVSSADADDLDQLLADDTIAGEADLSMLATEEPPLPKRVRPAAAIISDPEPEEQFDGPAWFYKSLGQEIGPVAHAEILHLVENGELTPNDFVRTGAGGAWQRAGRISGLFPDNYAETQARLKDAAAKLGVSSQRLGEKGLAALAAEIDKPTPPPAPVEERTSQKSKKKTKKGARPKITDADDYAASILAEETEEDTPRPRARTEVRSHVPATEHESPSAPDIPSTETRPLNAVKTPLPPTRSFTPPPAAPSTNGFKRGPAKKSSSGGGGFSLPFELPFDSKKSMIVGAVILALVGGYFLPLRSMLGLGYGSAPMIYNQAAFMFGKIRALREDKKAKQEDWEMLKSELSANINRHLGELKSSSGSLASNLVKCEECLQEILDKGKSHPPELYEKAKTALQDAKKALPKK